MAQDSYHHANLKQELIDVGLRLVLEEGLDALSLRRLAAECGVSHAAPYKHFKSKGDIFAAILNQAEAAFTQGLNQALNAMAQFSPKERLVELGVAYVRFFAENPDYFRLLFLSDCLSLHPIINLAEAPPPEDSSLNVFYKTATEYLAFIRADERNRATDILAMWAMVHGLTVLLVNRTLLPDSQTDYRIIVEQILSNNLVFP